jgi:hydroxyacid-oxoacid transhydrogenase
MCVVTDGHLASISGGPVDVVLESLRSNQIKYTLYDRVAVEPTDVSFREAAEFVAAQQRGSDDEPIDSFIAVGGGSVIDTAKAANLYSTHPVDDFFDYVNAPIGKGVPVPGPLKPLVAVPTTSGTGSESTGVAVFDWLQARTKTGIAHRYLKPTLGIVDADNAKTLPRTVIAASGFDAFCHAIESYTALPYWKRPRATPAVNMRPAYQGANPIADVWCIAALELGAKYLPRFYDDPSDEEARTNMMMAGSFGGSGIASAGTQLCHAASYNISGRIRAYRPDDYPGAEPIVPHGISVIMTAPAVFRFTAYTDLERHSRVATILGAAEHPLDGAGEALADRIAHFMKRMDVPNGLNALDYTEQDIDVLVEGTLPQKRLLAISPVPDIQASQLASIFRNSMSIY